MINVNKKIYKIYNDSGNARERLIGEEMIKKENINISEKKPDHLIENRKILKNISLLFWALLCGASISCLRLVSWTFQNWGNLKADELIYTLTSNLTGTNLTMVKNGIYYCIPLGIVTGIVMLLLYIYVSKKENNLKRYIIISGTVMSIFIIAGGAIFFFYKIEFFDYIKSQNQYSTFIDENYVAPDSVQMTFPETKRNLIYLYIESMEISFSDTIHGGGKKEDLIPELTELALDAETFSGDFGILNGGYSLYGSTYTMGGMFAQTTGLPLTIPHTQIQLSESFMPNVIALGDILEEAGYHNVLCIGTDAAFADRDKYFKEHGNYTLYDYNYSVMNGEIPLDYTRDFWGYDDHILYENAKKHLLELAKEDKPFNFTMLTVDTHAEDGYLCSLCSDTYSDKYSNVIACSSAQATEFVRWVQKQEFYKNTTIILVGDHCSMDSNIADDMPKDYERRIYTAFINPDPNMVLSTNQFRQYSSMDFFPSTLAALGVQIEGERLGLGTNLFSEEVTLVEQYGVDVMNINLAQKSALLEQALGDERKRNPLELRYDDNLGTLHIAVKDIEYAGDYSGVRCVITHEESGLEYSFDLTKEGNDYVVDVSLDKGYYNPGKYNCDVYLILPSKLHKWYNSGSLNIEKMAFVPSAEFLLSKDSDALGVIYKQNETNYPNIYFAVWSEENGQDDLVWYTAEKKDGSWVKLINLSLHTKDGNLLVHIYGGEDHATELLYTGTLPLNQFVQCDEEVLNSVFS